MLKLQLHTWTFDYICLYVYVCFTLLFRWTTGYCMWCCAIYIGELSFVDLSLPHCCHSSPLDCICGAPMCHLCMCHIVTGSVWGICDWRGTLKTVDLEKMSEKERSKSFCISVIGLFSAALSALSRKSCRILGRVMGEIFWCIQYECVYVCVGACNAL